MSKDELDKYIKIPIIRKNFDTTKAAKYKGIIEIKANKFGLVYDWKINFTYVDIDLCTTASWFVKNPTFIKRKELFKRLELEQVKRKDDRKHEIVNISGKKLEYLNNYFNDRTKYNSKIKIIIAVLKGSNKSGEFSKPSAAEMIIDNDDSLMKNFTILLDDLTIARGAGYKFSDIIVHGDPISFKEFFELNPIIKRLFHYMQGKKEKKEIDKYRSDIKAYRKKYNGVIKQAKKIVKKERSKYTKRIKDEVIKLPFGHCITDKFERCHLFECATIKNRIAECLQEGKSYDYWKSMVSDPNNFIPLLATEHNFFDRNWFTYLEDGDVYPLNKNGKEFIKNNIKKGWAYKKIPIWFLNKERLNYLKMRNENLGIKQNKYKNIIKLLN